MGARSVRVVEVVAVPVGVHVGPDMAVLVDYIQEDDQNEMLDGADEAARVDWGENTGNDTFAQ